MRLFVLLLVLANFGVWAYLHWIKPRPQLSEPYAGPGIELLRELPADSPLRAVPSASATPGSSDTAAPDAPPAATPDSESGADSPPEATPVPEGAADAASVRAAVATRCVVVGPFVEPEAADTAAALLAADDIATTQYLDEGEIWDGYWVYIPGIGSRDAARAMLAKLAENGIGDAYMIPDSDSGTLISLGVFSDISSAGSQAARVGRLGFEATIADRLREAETTWLRMTLTDDSVDVPALLQEPGRINRLKQRDCGAPAE